MSSIASFLMKSTTTSTEASSSDSKTEEKPTSPIQQTPEPTTVVQETVAPEQTTEPVTAEQKPEPVPASDLATELPVTTETTEPQPELPTVEVDPTAEVKVGDSVDDIKHDVDPTNGLDVEEEEDGEEFVDDQDVPEITLGSVKDLPAFLGTMPYEDVRKGLYHRYGLLVRDEQSIPGVYMISYNKSERDTVHKRSNCPELTDDEKALVHQYRGVIVEKDTNRPLCYTFDKMSRHVPDEWDLKDCRVTESTDGSQIKVFYYDKAGYWVVSTTRRIDASRCYFFSNKSFMEMFSEAAQNLNWDRLNKSCCYSFVMAHPDNRVVARHDKPSLTHVLTRDMTTLKLVEDDVGIPKSSPVGFDTKADMWRAVKRLPHWKEGFVVYHKPSSTYVKVINKKYQEVKNLRGSSSSLLFHFFDLRRRNKVGLFLKYYSEFQDTFRYFEDCYNNLCLLAYNEYVLFRVRRVLQRSDVLRFLNPVLYRIHGIHLSKRIRIRLADVREHLNNYPPHVLRRLVDTANGLPYSFI